jgi:hypothetical protein
MENLPAKYQKIWLKCRPLLKNGRPGDLEHAMDTARTVLDYAGKLKFDRDVLVPVAMMHDIGHVAILPEHFRFVSGSEKIVNSKLVHMLAGAKIADDILRAVGYAAGKRKKIVELISMHDFDQLKDIDAKKVYDTADKKFFHDVDALDRYNTKRLDRMKSLYDDKKKLLAMIEKMIDLFFYEEFKEIAKARMAKMK